ncbi:MAG TPA: RimK family alpha-L-glutamate ligase [Gemmatimonadaceae bacterium]|nr:RimK family alpha-L-glutamate ligase [Gemmatimonadaceae bacterium]
MRVAILSARTGWHTDELQRALAARGHTGIVLPYEGLTARLGPRPEGAPALASDGEALDDVDAVLARIIPNGSLEQIILRVDVLHWVEERGVIVMNSPRAIERTVDKFYTSALLEHAGLRTPQTVVCERPEQAMDAFRAMGDVIVKPLFGSMGLGMVRVSDEEMAWRVFRALDAVRAVYYVQRAVEHDGCDVRIFLVGGRVIGAIERHAAQGAYADARLRTAAGQWPAGRRWRTNISRGGQARAISPSAEWCDLACRAARVVGADYAGVDLLPARDGPPYVLEVNGIPGWSGLQDATGVDVAGAIVRELEAKGESGERRKERGTRLPNDGPLPQGRFSSLLSPISSLAAAAQLACLLEVSAPKPGNVRPGMHFHDTRYEDFLASAVAIGGPMGRAGMQPLGVTIRQAVEATAQWTRANTNLGIVLLLAPLARAALVGEGERVRAGGDALLRTRVARVLHETTVEDAREAYRAIRLAAPGGLGSVPAQDVAEEPSVTLREAMAMASERDSIAREYATGFATTFEVGVPALERARAAGGGKGLDWSDAIVETYLTLLATVPDTLIARKCGIGVAEAVSGQARAVLDAGGVRTEAGRQAARQLDASLRDARNTRNPGTTADLTTAAIFVALVRSRGGDDKPHA